MAKAADKKKVVAKAADTASASEPTVNVPTGGVEHEKTTTKADPKVKYPEGTITGKFHSVVFGGGYVVYNPNGQRATGVVTEAQAKDLVMKNNRDAGIKG